MLKYYLLYWFSPPALTEGRNSQIMLAGKSSVSLLQGRSENLNNQDNCKTEFWAAHASRNLSVSECNFTSFWPKQVVLPVLLAAQRLHCGGCNISTLRKQRTPPQTHQEIILMVWFCISKGGSQIVVKRFHFLYSKAILRVFIKFLFHISLP